MFQSIDQFLAYPPSYHRCMLLVHPDITRLVKTTQKIAAQYNWSSLSIGQEMSRALQLELPDRRVFKLPKAFSAAIDKYAPGPLLCTNIDLLFNPDLEQDPLRLFLDASRQITLLVCWPGNYENNILSYALAGHAHYHTWPYPDLCNYCIVTL